jgi:hypothetical protein
VCPANGSACTRSDPGVADACFVSLKGSISQPFERSIPGGRREFWLQRRCRAQSQSTWGTAAELAGPAVVKWDAVGDAQREGRRCKRTEVKVPELLGIVCPYFPLGANVEVGSSTNGIND